MASNPPFSVEDNTDEDFFDKLVDDDDDVDFKVSTSAESGGRHVVSDGNESDEAKAFANLSINELDDHGEVNVEQVSSSDRSVVDDLSAKVETAEQISKVETGERHGIPLVSADSFEFGTVLQKLENENGGANVLVNADSGEAENVGVSDMPVLSKTTSGSEIGARGVKEVAWSAFNEESVQNDSNGFGSYSDFFTEFGGENPSEAFNNTVGVTSKNGLQDAVGNDVHGSTYMDTADNYGQYNHTQNDSIAADQSSSVQDMSSTQYWENQYPGWQYDYGTGQWYQVDGYDGGSTVEGNADSNVTSTWGGAGGQVDLSYMQQTGHSVSGAVAEAGKTETVSNWNQTSLASDATETTNWNQVSEVSGNSSVVSSDWNQASNDNNGYPAHMVFDPQYPGWYYDTIAQEWRALESYAQSEQSTAQVHDKMSKDDYSFTDTFSQNNTLTASSSHDQGNNYNPQIFGSQSPDQNWLGSANNYNQQNSRMWLPDKTGTAGEAGLQYTENQVTENNYAQNVSASLHGSQQSNAHYAVNGPYYENLSQHQNNNYSMPSQFVGGNFSQHFNDSKVNQNDQKYFSNDFYGNQNAVNFSQQQIQNTPMTYNPALGRSSAGRPAHALVAFGFGGKLVVMNHNNSNENLNYGSQNPVGGSITVLNLSEVVTGNIDAVNHGSTYFQALCQHSLPGPLTGGSVATKELNKWIEERLNSEPAHMDYRKAEVLKLLLSLLKIACQYYGKLRSPYGTDAAMKESDAPESAVAKLFAFAKRNGSQFNQYGDITRCLQQLPSEGQLQATAAEVQNLLVSGRKKEALECAQEGQLWGPALVLAAQLGDQFYVDTVKQMALRQLVAGSPLRTLCLLIAGQPADVFSADTAAVNNMTGSINVPQQPAQFGANCMLDDWEENLAVITANRTKDDELVLIHLGDCLWKERSDIIAAHICYLVAESSFEPYSDSARLCLIGANHLKMPRTYASPEAIQRTEIYEYSKTLGNSQSVLLSFQPYKYVYALMLAEVGRTSEALKYCQAVLKSLKTGRTHELENLRNLVSSLEDRIKAHQQGGFSVNLAPKEFIGKLLNLFDSTAHRVVGGLPPPAPTSGGAVYGNENHYQSSGPRSQADPSKEATSASTQDKASAGGGTSRLGRFSFGSQLFQKTVGLVLNRQGRQRWVEEGVDPPAPEAALPPPPKASVFQNGASEMNSLQSEPRNNGNLEFKSPSTMDNSPGMPPLPPTANQYSARGRMGVRSRYVDTFNRGGGNTVSGFQSPFVPSAKPAGGINPKFFVPAPVSHAEQLVVEEKQNASTTYENPSSSPPNDSCSREGYCISYIVDPSSKLHKPLETQPESGMGNCHTRITQGESDAPESAVAKLFAFAKRNGSQFNQYGDITRCLQQLPSEGQLQATAAEVQNLLVSGRKQEALECAQEGQLWGPALFYVDTVKQMALRQLVAGSPLRTLCLLIAGQPADVFSADTAAVNNMTGSINVPQQPAQFGANCMLDDWEENLAVITANRTKDDELVLIHLGDCLWKERSDIIAAHICYLVAESSFEPYSDSARLCLIGANHLKMPRTYASPEAIQVLSSGRILCKLSSQGIYRKIAKPFDSTAHRVVGGLPPPAPTSGGAVYGNENHYQSSGPRVSSSQSTMAMSSLVPQSMEPINEWAADNKKIMHTRSVSEPDFGRSPMQSQADPSKEATSASTQDKASAGGGTSRLGRFSFGSQLFQKTVGLVLNRQGRQAKLGETNKFYYDEKLKRWVEEGVDPPAPEAALPPPPKASVFQNGASEMNSLQSEPRNNGNLEFKSPSTMDNSPGMPPLPPTANQYSARGRMGVRSRYVDTFNRGGGNTVSGFQSPFVPSAKPAGGINPKFFVPAPVSHAEQLVVEEKQNASTTYENPSSSPPNDSFHSPTPSSSMAAMQRFGSMSNIYNKGANDSSFALHSRRTASWGGSLNDSMSPPNRGQPPGEPLGMRPPSFRQSDTSLADSSVSGGSFGEELQEVEL
ncbi:hypothetical protein SASPL_120975 [Salvia splendens]|uniref:Protein transport protein sec16 n=1 Tax=Salvia splendens TaxID=180675 RepID=A0A8X8XQM0_SALSN|nr:hypothetical protein SASPL_120975 [Salvia splendens]